MKILKPQYLIILLATFWATTSNAQIDYATGRASITKSIYTLSEGNISVPIGLDYDASGIQVSAIASEVGLNWSLNAGGRIVRIVRDKPDESVLNWGKLGTKDNYLRTGFITNIATNTTFAFSKDLEPDLFVLNIGNMSANFVIVPDATNSNKPKVVLIKQNQDINIEVVGYTGSLPASNQQPYYAPLDTALNHNNRRMGLDNGLLYFKVTMPDGLVYVFGENVQDREYAFSFADYQSTNFLYPLPQGPGIKPIKGVFGISAPNTWMLSRIIQPKISGTLPYQEVKFNYKRTHSLPPNILTFSKDFEYHGTNCPAPQSIIINSLNSYPISFMAQLVSIESNNIKVEFNSSQLLGTYVPSNISSIIPDYETGTVGDVSRKDVFSASNQSMMPNDVTITFSELLQTLTRSNPIKNLSPAEALRNIVVIDKTTNVKTGFYLHRDYYYDFSYNNQTAEQNESAERKLRLLGVYPVSFSDGQITMLKGTRYSYNGSTLPSHLSPARDHWGYFNGSNSNAIRTGALALQPYRNPTTLADQTVCNSSLLTPNLASSLNGVLMAINLPEGGTVEYEYGLHDCDNYHTDNTGAAGSPTRTGHRPVGGLRVNKMRTYNPADNTTYTTKYTYTKLNSTESSGFLSIWPDNIVMRFESNQWEQSIMPNYYGLLQSRFINGFYLTYRRVREENIATVNGQEKNNGYTVYEFNVGEDEPFTVLNNAQWLNTTSIGKAQSSYMRAGILPKFSFIKGLPSKITTYRQDDTVVEETSNTYTITDNSQSVGIKGALNLPAYPVTVNTIIPQNFTNTYNGIVGFPGDFNGTTNTTGFILNGLFYKLTPIAFFAQFIAAVVNTVNDIATPIDETKYRIVTYNLPVGKINLSKTTNKYYDQAGLTPIETTTMYDYASTKHNQPTRIASNYSTAGTFVASTQDQLETYMVYSPDYTIAPNTTDPEIKGILALQNRKIIAPVEAYSLRNTKVVGAIYNQFWGDAATPDSYGQLYRQHALELTAPLTIGATNSATVFKPSAVVGASINKNQNYVAQTENTDFNTRGLLLRSRSIADPTLKSAVQYGYNNLIPTTSTTAEGTSLARNQSFEYIPLFGMTKATAPDNTFVSSEYDGFGCMRLAKDHQSYVIQSQEYNYAATAAPTSTITIELVAECVSNVIKQLNVGTAVTMAEIQAVTNPLNPCGNGRVNLRSVPQMAYGSQTVELTGPSAKSTSDVGVVKLFSAGMPANMGTYTATVRVYSRPNASGTLVGYKKIAFQIVP
jgi:hypothetical protein